MKVRLEGRSLAGKFAQRKGEGEKKSQLGPTVKSRSDKFNSVSGREASRCECVVVGIRILTEGGTHELCSPAGLYQSSPTDSIENYLADAPTHPTLTWWELFSFESAFKSILAVAWTRLRL